MRDVASSAAMLDRLALLFVITCSACRPSAAAPARTTNPTVATPPKPTSSATTEISIDAITCDPQVPAWERALAEGYAWDLLHPGDFDGIHAARGRASAAVDALQQDDPRYIEAHCRAGFAHHNLMNVGVADKHFRRALEVLRRRGITDAEASYATAGQRAFSIELSFDFDPKAKREHRVTLMTTTGVSLDADDCRTPDIALLELARSNLFAPANRAQMRDVPKPKVSKLGTLEADTAAALQDEIEAALGPRHRLSLAMREHMVAKCDDKQQRKFPARCPAPLAMRERNLADRTAALGKLHPDTRFSALFLGGDRLAAGRVADAKALFERAATGEPDDTWIAAMQLLAGLELDAGRTREGFARLQRVAQALPTAATDRYWGVMQAWRLHAQAALLTGHREEAERGERERAKIEADYFYVGAGGPSLGMVAATADSGATAQPDNKLHDTALSGLINAHDHALRRAEIRPDARAWRVAELDVALQCRALFRHRVGSEGPAKADLQALASLRASTR